MLKVQASPTSLERLLESQRFGYIFAISVQGHGLAKYIYSQTAKSVFSHLNYSLRSRRLKVMGSRKNGHGAREGNTPLPLPSCVSLARLFLSCAVTSKQLLHRLSYL